VSQNRLRDSKSRHHENEERVKEEKAAQLLFGIDEGMAHEEKGRVEETELQSHQPIKMLVDAGLRA